MGVVLEVDRAVSRKKKGSSSVNYCSMKLRGDRLDEMCKKGKLYRVAFGGVKMSR